MRSNYQKTICLALSGCFIIASALTGCTPEAPPVDEKKAFQDTFIVGTPDVTVTFPEAEFAEAKKLKDARKFDSAEKLLMSKLDDAKVSARGTTQLGQYLVRLNNILFEEGKDKQAIQYGEVAEIIFYNQPIEKRPVAPWFVNIHSYLGMSYERLHDYANAEKSLKKAISIASGAPKAEVQPSWIKLIYQRLAAVYDAQKKKKEADLVKEQIKKLNLG